MESVSSIEQLKECFVNNKPILFIKKYPEYDLKKEGIITSIDESSAIIMVKIEERIFYKIVFHDPDVTFFKGK